MAGSASPSSLIRPLGDAPLLNGFRLQDVLLDTGVTIRAAVDGNGPPLLLLHGHPQTHVTWRKVAPALLRSTLQ
jgi:haloacetate dehalogenase